MNAQDEFTAAMRALAEERQLDLIVDHGWSNTGHYSSCRPRLTYRAEEIVVESVAYSACASLGLDTAGDWFRISPAGVRSGRASKSSTPRS